MNQIELNVRVVSRSVVLGTNFFLMWSFLLQTVIFHADIATKLFFDRVHQTSSSDQKSTVREHMEGMQSHSVWGQ